jgi:flagellar protein FliO/FliZ
MDFLFGGMPDAARFIVAFVLVLILIGAAAFLWRKFGTGTLNPTGPRGRQPRLAVVDAASVDGRRRLVLIRRDNVEHLVMIGGPTDIVVEPNISRAGSNSARDPRPIPTADIPPRPPSPLEGPGWTQPLEPPARPIRSMEDLDGPRPDLAPRSAREAMADTMRAMRSEPPARTMPPAAPYRPEPDDEITAPALTPPPMPEPSFHAPAMPEPRRPVMPVPPPPPAYEPVFQAVPEPPRRAPAPPAPPPYEPVFQTAPEPKRSPPPSQEPLLPAMPEPQWPPPPPPPPTHEPVFQSGAGAEPKRTAAATPRPSQNDESNLAEMAQRLEAALRRPTKPVEPPPPPPSPVSAPPPAPSPVARPAAAPASRAAAHFETPNPRGTAKATDLPPASELRIMSGPGKGDPPFESLEDEMAKMLGRSPGKT